MQLAQYYRDYNGPMMHDFSRSDNWMGAILGLVFLIVLVSLVIYIVKVLATHNQTTQRDPLEIAKERFAKGEISKEEFAEIKKELK